MTDLSTDERIATFANEAAFPRPTQYRETDSHNVLLAAQWGLTKRELFAAMVMQGIVANKEGPAGNWEKCAAHAVKAADALLSALEHVK